MMERKMETIIFIKSTPNPEISEYAQCFVLTKV